MTPRKAEYGKSLLDIPVTIKIGRKKTLTASPLEMQKKLNEMRNKKMDQQPTHTPTPWKIDTTYTTKDNMLCAIVGDKECVEVVNWCDEDDATFIVRAVNEYEMLKTALVKIGESKDVLLEACKLAKDSLVGATLHSQKFVNEKLKQAIAQAEGK